MALSSEITLPNGIALSYWRVTSMTVVVNQQVIVELTGYVSEEARKAEADALAEARETGEYPETNIYMDTQFLTFPYDPDMSVSKAYALVKQLEGFQDAEDVIDQWAAGQSYYVGDIVLHEGARYECLQSHDSQTGWEPPDVPALWSEVAEESGEIPEWVQPTGAHDAYSAGDHVMHVGKEWVSTIDANVYEPGVYGWSEGGE